MGKDIVSTIKILFCIQRPRGEQANNPVAGRFDKTPF